VSFDFTEGKYLFQMLTGITNKLTVFIPEHGLFAEQQDQVIIEKTDLYEFIDDSIRFVSLYCNSHEKTGDILGQVKELDTLIFDIQDVGSRYYTYITTIAEIFKIIAENKLNISVVVIDRPNPAGRQVEGTRLPADFSSLIGWTGLLHRYGLTIGELCGFLRANFNGEFTLDIIKNNNDKLPINPSPNIPDKKTCMIFSGQCLLEGTNLSEGRGTTRPFEIFGAPFLKDLSEDWVITWNELNTNAVLRSLLFVPTFHQYKDEICYGFQLHAGERFHSLLYSLKMIRSLMHHSKALSWLTGPYEAGSEKPAIELLTGDDDLMRFLKEDMNESLIVEKLKQEEQIWIEMTRPFQLYDKPLFSLL